ncbi:MAG: hypothetical protein IT200_12585 [Thermoleophilia bacterium]|nr:hypothetical protein [Thermoleophilia bacterium]
MTRSEAVRLVAALGAVEMALVRRDPVAGPLLAQAARAAAGLPPGPYVSAAAALARAVELHGPGPGAAAARKAAQALCRAAAQAAQGAALA